MHIKLADKSLEIRLSRSAEFALTNAPPRCWQKWSCCSPA